MTLERRTLSNRWSLHAAFEYFGAHRVPRRYEHERDRGWQRVAIGLLLAPVGILIGQWRGVTSESLSSPFVIAPMLYGMLGLAYLVALRARPRGFVWAQYAFLMCDPIVVLSAIVFEPKVFAFLGVLLLVVVSRVGIRFGLRSLALSWTSAFIGAIALMTATDFWRRDAATALLVFAGLAVVAPLFIPLIKIQSRSRDLDLQQAKVNAMVESLAARSEFLTRVSHELRSPLQVIRSSVDLLELRQEVPQEIMRKMRRAESGLSVQLRDLLTLAVSEAGKLMLTPRKIDLSQVFSELIEELRDTAQSKGLELRFAAPTCGVVVIVDAARISQIAENLLTNAIKYTGTGAVTLTLKPFDEARGLVRFDVQDTGVGIRAEDVPMIFAPYERARANAYSRDSAGVGLAVVQTLLAHLGGNVTVTSVVGEGSTFSVEVAASQPASPEAPAPRRRVLIVDDREDILGSLSELVEVLGYTTDRASTAGAAGNLLATHCYDAVLFDLQMPVVSGSELASEVRRGHGPNHATCFIAMTAGEDSEEGREWPFDHFVRKPVTARTLRRLLDAQTPTRVPT